MDFIFIYIKTMLLSRIFSILSVTISDNAEVLMLTKTARMPRLVGGDEWLCRVRTSLTPKEKIIQGVWGRCPSEASEAPPLPIVLHVRLLFRGLNLEDIQTMTGHFSPYLITAKKTLIFDGVKDILNGRKPYAPFIARKERG